MIYKNVQDIEKIIYLNLIKPQVNTLQIRTFFCMFHWIHLNALHLLINTGQQLKTMKQTNKQKPQNIKMVHNDIDGKPQERKEIHS